jgi:hypothetical protein
MSKDILVTVNKKNVNNNDLRIPSLNVQRDILINILRTPILVDKNLGHYTKVFHLAGRTRGVRTWRGKGTVSWTFFNRLGFKRVLCVSIFLARSLSLSVSLLCGQTA